MPSFVEADLVERALAYVLPAPVRSSGAMLIAVNLVPLYGVLVWQWPVFYVMALYWAENVIAGVYTLLRMIVANPLAGVPLGVFFSFHYGMFCFVHGMFVNALFNPAARGNDDALRLVHVLLTTPGLRAAVLLMALSHGWSFVSHFLGRPREGTQDLRRIMMRPYGRMVLLHVTILVGGFAVTALHAPLAPLVFLILLKTGIDLGLHRRANVRAVPVPALPPTAPPLATSTAPPHEHPFEISGGGGIVPSPRGNSPPPE